MKLDTWKCDICQLQKAETNRWWLVQRILVEGVSIGVTVVEWEHGVPEGSDAHLCGAEHVLQWISKQVLGEKRVDEQPNT